MRGSCLRKHAGFEGCTTRESIAGCSVFNKKHNLRTEEPPKKGTPSRAPSPHGSGPQAGIEAGDRRYPPGYKRNICCSDALRRIEINVTPAGRAPALESLPSRSFLPVDFAL